MSDPLEGIYAAIARVTARLDRVHGERLLCRRGCSSCCLDDLTVFEVEAENIRRHHAALLEGGRPAPPGRCAFLDTEGACRIYAHRPYVCRTQGYPLRWDEASDDGEEIQEMRDICPLNEPGTPIVELPARDCWPLGPVERRLFRLQSLMGSAGRRVPLRGLFRRTALTFGVEEEGVGEDR